MLTFTHIRTKFSGRLPSPSPYFISQQGCLLDLVILLPYEGREPPPTLLSFLPSPVPHSLSSPQAGRIPRAEHAISLQGAAAATGKMQKHNQKEHLYKLLVIGDLGVGKTSIIKRYVHQNFSPHYRATIGVDFALKVLNWDAETVVRLQLWDIAGEYRGEPLAPLSTERKYKM